MKRCQRLWCLTLLLTLSVSVTLAAPSAEAVPEIGTHRLDEPQFVVITEDVIPDVMNTTKQVIRVNPLDLPTSRNDLTGSVDSSLYNIQSLQPAHRKYVSSNRLRKTRPHKQQQSPDLAEDSPILRHLPLEKSPKVFKPKQQKQQHLHFLYNQDDIAGHAVGKTMRVHVAPGAYPVYYAVSKSNGRFGKYPLKGFRNQAAFMKYLLKSKLEPIDLTKRFDS